MIRSFLPLAVAILAIPAAALAAPPAGNAPAEIVVVPVAVAPVPVMAIPAAPAALIRQIDEMQRAMQVRMQALEQLAASPLALVSAMAGPGAVPGGVTRITMARAGDGEGVCSEQMAIVPGRDGRMRVFVRRSAGCAPQAAAVPGHPPQALRGYPPRALSGYPPRALHPQAHPRLPADALPPPSKTIEAEDLVPGRAHAVG